MPSGSQGPVLPQTRSGRATVPPVVWSSNCHARRLHLGLRAGRCDVSELDGDNLANIVGDRCEHGAFVATAVRQPPQLHIDPNG